MAADKQFVYNQRLALKISGYIALVAILLFLVLFRWVPFYGAYLLGASLFGLAGFLLELLQLRLHVIQQLRFLFTPILIFVMRLFRLFLLPHETPYGAPDFQFLFLTIAIWFSLCFLFRRQLSQRLNQLSA